MAWLEAALAPEWSLRDLQSVVSRGNGVQIGDADGEPIGLAIVLKDLPLPGCAGLPFLTVAPERRFRGLGGETGLALVSHLKAQGVENVYAPVPDGRGLAVYFWLRLGFRPLLQAESPGPVVGLKGERMRGIWMRSEELSADS
jgi:GNAT superfamily N-acetyltransferase